MNARPEFSLIANLTAMLGAALLAGCDREAERKEGEFRIVADSPASTTDELCEVAEAAASAWLRRQNSERYSHWSAEAGRYCGLKELGIMFPPRRSDTEPK